MHRIASLLPILGLFLQVACGPQDEVDDHNPDGPIAAQLALNWFPDAQHGGYYAAQLHGFNRAEGVEITILGGGPDAPVVQRVATGQVEFGLTNADGVINARAAGAPIIALFAPYQINPRCIVVHESTGITEIGQIEDLTLALSQRPAFSHFLRKRFPFRNVSIVPYHGSVTPFLEDDRYAMQGYVFSEPVVARRMGADARALMVAETGFNPYASVLITTETTVRQQPAMVAAVVRASRQGWARYLDTPLETNQHIQSLNPEMDLETLATAVELSHGLVLDEVAAEKGIGHMSKQRWELLAEQMVEAAVIEAEQVQPSQCYTLKFLETGAAL
jgi:NitT/TauT family transport system substrate-binding protein